MMCSVNVITMIITMTIIIIIINVATKACWHTIHSLYLNIMQPYYVDRYTSNLIIITITDAIIKSS